MGIIEGKTTVKLWKPLYGTADRSAVDVPGELCPWKTAYNCFNQWTSKGLWENFSLSYEVKLIRNGYSLTEVMSGLISMRVELGVEKTGPSCSRGESTTKLHLTADTHGNPINFEITRGEIHDAKVADVFLEKVEGTRHFIADKGYDLDPIREPARNAGMTPVIPRRSNSAKPNPCFDSHLYKLRNLVENLFARLKHFPSITTRFEKLARNFKFMLYLACSLIWIILN